MHEMQTILASVHFVIQSATNDLAWIHCRRRRVQCMPRTVCTGLSVQPPPNAFGLLFTFVLDCSRSAVGVIFVVLCSLQWSHWKQRVWWVVSAVNLNVVWWNWKILAVTMILGLNITQCETAYSTALIQAPGFVRTDALHFVAGCHRRWRDQDIVTLHTFTFCLVQVFLF